MWQGQRVSIVFPCYNEEAGIAAAVQDFGGQLYVDEVVVVDNNSRDRSADLARAAGARVVDEAQQGYGYALRRGMREAQGDLIILAEPDGTFSGKDVIKLLAYSDDFAMVLGTRTTSELIWAEANMGFLLRMGNLAVAKLLEWLFSGPALSDCGCTLRLARREVVQELQDHFTVGGSHFLPEMVCLGLLAGIPMIEVPVNYRGRLGMSKITGSFRTAMRVGARMIRLIVGYRLRAWAGRSPVTRKVHGNARHAA